MATGRGANVEPHLGAPAPEHGRLRAGRRCTGNSSVARSTGLATATGTERHDRWEPGALRGVGGAAGTVRAGGAPVWGRRGTTRGAGRRAPASRARCV